MAKASRVDLADSALAAPAAGFGDHEFHPDLCDKAAVLACRLAWNHPLIDGNKRAAWAALVLFIDLNGGRWDPDPPDVDDAEHTMIAILEERRSALARHDSPRYDHRRGTPSSKMGWAANSLSMTGEAVRLPGPESVLQAHHDDTELLSPVRMAPS